VLLIAFTKKSGWRLQPRRPSKREAARLGHLGAARKGHAQRLT